MENNIPTGVTDPAYLPDSRMKPCPRCVNEAIPGMIEISPDDSGPCEAIKCPVCNGDEEVEMTFEECRDEDELIRESKADL